jgi:hypothetical protein
MLRQAAAWLLICAATVGEQPHSYMRLEAHNLAAAECAPGYGAAVR